MHVLPDLLLQQVQPLQHCADGVRLHVPHVLSLLQRLALTLILTLTSALPEVGQGTAAFVRARGLRSGSEGEVHLIFELTFNHKGQMRLEQNSPQKKSGPQLTSENMLELKKWAMQLRETANLIHNYTRSLEGAESWLVAGILRSVSYTKSVEEEAMWMSNNNRHTGKKASVCQTAKDEETNTNQDYAGHQSMEP